MAINEAYIRTILNEVVQRIPGEHRSMISDALLRETVLRICVEEEKRTACQDIVEAGQHFYHMGFLAGTSGNISVKLSDDSLLITPSGMVKGDMQEDDILHVDMEGNLLNPARGRPSSETKMHLFSYLKRPDIGAIVHAHPPFATGFASAGVALDMPVLPEAILILGDVPLAPYGTPSTREVPASLEPYIALHNVFLLANHGALALGKDLKEAAHRMETLEFFAKVIYISRQLGGERMLNQDQVRTLQEAYRIFQSRSSA